MIHAAFFVLTGLVSVANLLALGGLVHAIMRGHASSGKSLARRRAEYLGDECRYFLAVVLEPRQEAARRCGPKGYPDLVFTQQTLPVSFTRRIREPGYVDYLFLAFTNATAFSPADTFPLTPRAKILMMVQALISLVTIALVAARAVGILA